VYVSFAVIIVITVCSFIGIASLPDSTYSQQEVEEATGLYAVSIVSFLFFVDLSQWCIRQVINSESMMVSVERCFYLIDVEHEKPVITEYDKKMNLTNEEYVSKDINEEGRNSQQKLKKEE
jgi:hypothetical protein